MNPRLWLRVHRKGVIAVAGAVLSMASLAFPASPYVISAVSVATAFGVYRVPNAPARPKGEIVP